MNKHISEAKRLKAEIAILKADLERHEGFIKAELTARGRETYECGKDDKRITVSWKEISKKRLDQKRLKAEQPEIVEAYTVQATEKRFSMRH